MIHDTANITLYVFKKSRYPAGVFGRHLNDRKIWKTLSFFFFFRSCLAYIQAQFRRQEINLFFRSDRSVTLVHLPKNCIRSVQYRVIFLYLQKHVNLRASESGLFETALPHRSTLYGGIFRKDKGEAVKGKFRSIDSKGFSKLSSHLFN